MPRQDAGSMDQFVEIHRDSGTSLENSGGRVPSVAKLMEGWAEIQQEGGRELVYARQAQAETTHVVIMWINDDTRGVKALTDHVLWGTRKLNIIGVEIPEQLGAIIKFRCVEIS